MLRRGLHADVEMVRVEVYRKIMEMSKFSDRILIFYGTCGHSLSNLEKDFESLGCQLYFLKDENGETVEDCISAALGGNDVYARTLVNGEGAGTFYLTPMWASNWEEKPKDNAIFSSEFDNKVEMIKEAVLSKITQFLMMRDRIENNCKGKTLIINPKTGFEQWVESRYLHGPDIMNDAK